MFKKFVAWNQEIAKNLCGFTPVITLDENEKIKISTPKIHSVGKFMIYIAVTLLVSELISGESNEEFFKRIEDKYKEK